MALPNNWRDVAEQVRTSAQQETGNWYDRSPAADKRFKAQQKVLQERQKRLQAQVDALSKKVALLKKEGGKDAKRRLAAAQDSLKGYQDQLRAVGKNLQGLEQKYYTSTGQYEKLLTGANRDAFLALESVFKQYGLGSLAGKIYDYVKNGYSSDTISILLQDTKEYKERFAANAERVKAGLPVLSPADYINTENAYRQLLRQSGLPEGFYDSNKDFTEWIAQDVSPTEIQSRVDMATQATALANPFYKQALNQIGIDDGHMAAYFLDTDRALPLLQKAAATAQIGAAALQQGLTFDRTFAEQLATSGVSGAEAQQGYSQVAAELGTMTQLAAMQGQTWTQTESEKSVFGQGPEASAKKAGIIGAERGQFAGGTGGARAGLGQSQAAQ